jgi:drug/metabolite transporter (DMT)-like permease
LYPVDARPAAPPRRRFYALMICICVMWGTQHPALKVLADAMPSLTLNLWRLVLTLAALYPFARRDPRKPPLEAKARMMALGVLGFGIYTMLLTIGLHRSTAVNSAILVNAHPLITALLAPLLIGEASSGRMRGWMLAGFLGVAAVVSEGFSKVDLFGGRYTAGNCLLLVSALCLSLYTIWLKEYASRFGPLLATFYAVLGGTIALLTLAAAGAAPLGSLLTVTAAQFVTLLYVAWATTALGWVVWFKAVSTLGAAKGTNFLFIIPVSGVIFANLLLGEAVPHYAAAGAALTLASIYFVQRSRPIKSDNPAN